MVRRVLRGWYIIPISGVSVLSNLLGTVGHKDLKSFSVIVQITEYNLGVSVVVGFVDAVSGKFTFDKVRQ